MSSERHDDIGQGPDDKGQGPDDTGEGPDEVSTGWESIKLDVTTKKAEFQRNGTLLLYLFLVCKCEQGLTVWPV